MQLGNPLCNKFVYSGSKVLWYNDPVSKISQFHGVNLQLKTYDISPQIVHKIYIFR